MSENESAKPMSIVERMHQWEREREERINTAADPILAGLKEKDDEDRRAELERAKTKNLTLAERIANRCDAEGLLLRPAPPVPPPTQAQIDKMNRGY